MWALCKLSGTTNEKEAEEERHKSNPERRKQSGEMEEEGATNKEENRGKSK